MLVFALLLNSNVNYPAKTQRNEKTNSTMNKNKLLRIGIAIVVLLGYAISEYYPDLLPGSATTSTAKTDNTLLRRAIANGTSDVQVIGSGKVIKVLPDDTEGSKHQRFLVKIENQDVILIAHNIDLAPRVANLKYGDSIRFNGEYEWNDKGGVVHWTHKDPRSKHVHGWLEHQGNKYW